MVVCCEDDNGPSGRTVGGCASNCELSQVVGNVDICGNFLNSCDLRWYRSCEREPVLASVICLWCGREFGFAG